MGGTVSLHLLISVLEADAAVPMGFSGGPGLGLEDVLQVRQRVLRSQGPLLEQRLRFSTARS